MLRFRRPRHKKPQMDFAAAQALEWDADEAAERAARDERLRWATD